MSDQIIICPNCHNEIALSQALTHQIEEQLLASVRQEHQKELIAREKATEEKIKKEIFEKNELEIADLQKQLSEKKSKVEEMQKFELDLRKEKRELEEKTKELSLEVDRRLDQEKKKIEDAVAAKILEDHRLKEAEKDKIISDLKSALEDAQKKASQGSQQTQGEVLELELEQKLRAEFPLDKISEIKKGIRGADILQEVFDRNGRLCGKILWESKNAEWSNQWPAKLREDQRNAKADLAVLVSVNLPSDIQLYIFKDGIWTCAVAGYLALAYVLRYNLIQVQQIKIAATSKDGKKEDLYEYICGLEFKHRVDAMMEAYQSFLSEVDQEKNYFAKKWAKQEKNLRTLLDQTSSFRGELEAIIGEPSLPPPTPLADGQLKMSE